MAPGELNNATSCIRNVSENLIVGFEGNEDAGVYKINNDLALVQTVDFITPVVDDPYIYGQIAAANSLSDIFAMGGEVKTALNLIGFDSKHHSSEILIEILKGGESKVKESGGIVVGGHTIETLEMLYGLSVTGFINPGKIFRNNSVKEGDVIVLTKPVGTGILTTAVKADLISEKSLKEIVDSMTMLNLTASQIAKECNVSACTDVTGFGLLGHLFEMTGEKYTIEIDFDSIPYFEESLYQASLGIIPSGAYANKEFLKEKVNLKKELTFEQDILLYDPQTSGGLLLSVNEKESGNLLKKLIDKGILAKQIGFVKKSEDHILLEVK